MRCLRCWQGEPSERGLGDEVSGSGGYVAVFQASQEAHLAEIVNLNRARKARTRDEAKATAAANRASHVRTLSERRKVEAERLQASRLLDGARREHDPKDD